MKTVVSMIALAGLAGSAMADFNTGLQAGPFNSDGGAGAAANGVYNFTYTGLSAATYNSIRIRGTATSGGVGSYKSELRWRFVGESIIDSGALATGTTWTGGFAVDNSQSFSSFSMINGNSYSFRFWESFNDSGIDATWTNVQFDFGGPPPAPTAQNIGTYTAGPFDINTIGSGFDTEIGLYDSTGVLLANDDDSGGGLTSKITPTLANGLYYLAVGGYNTSFAGGWGVTAGSASGAFDVNVNGYLAIDDQILASGTVRWYSFRVIPTPGSIASLGLGSLLVLRRRR